MSQFKRETLRGEPIRVGDHEVVPEARVWSWQMKEAVIHAADHAAERGTWIVRARPTALIDRTGESTRRVPVIDVNRRLEVLLLITALALPIVLNAVALFVKPVKPR
jgi:hypothetical protein